MQIPKPLRRVALEAIVLALLAAAMTYVSVLPTLDQLSLPHLPAAPIAAVLIYGLFIAIVTLARRKQNGESKR